MSAKEDYENPILKLTARQLAEDLDDLYAELRIVGDDAWPQTGDEWLLNQNFTGFKAEVDADSDFWWNGMPMSKYRNSIEVVALAVVGE